MRHYIAEGYISAGRAREIYGVVVDDIGNLDAAETTALRDEMLR